MTSTRERTPNHAAPRPRDAWVGRPGTGALLKVCELIVSVLDHLTPKSRSVVIYTNTDLDEQAIELIPALIDQGIGRLTWLISRVNYHGAASTSGGASVRYVLSARGLWAYLRASVVVHSMSIERLALRPSKRRAFVNVWHGMPVKRVDLRASKAQMAATTTIATSAVHAENLRVAWQMAADRILVTGLPRNDALVHAANAKRDQPIDELCRGRRLVVWLPTYRRSTYRDMAIDGVDQGNVFQLPGADLATVDALMGELGCYLILKTHPLAEPPTQSTFENMSLWSDDDLAARSTTLYRTLGQADLLVTDYSSVWIDFLVLGKPIVFTVADRDEYSSSRGFLFADLEALLPGPMVSDLDGLRSAVATILDGNDPWANQRRTSQRLHHRTVDDGSSARIAVIVRELLDEVSGRSEAR